MASDARALRRRAVFLDRDGVINEDKGYVYKPEDLVVLPGVPEALVDLRARGFLLVVVSNQSGVARGYYGESDVERFHDVLREELDRAGASIDDVLYCPHLPDGLPGPYRLDCDCRKPKAGLVHEAARRHGIDLAASYLVGDKSSDIECAVAAGVRGIQVMTRGEPRHPKAWAAVGSLAEASRIIR